VLFTDMIIITVSSPKCSYINSRWMIASVDRISSS